MAYPLYRSEFYTDLNYNSPPCPVTYFTVECEPNAINSYSDPTRVYISPV